MPDTVYRRGKPGEMPRIIDFINYVFSQAHVPHDFKRLLPKVYGDEAPKGQEDFHFLALQEGQTVGCVALRPTTLFYAGEKLSCGFVGSVSVHPYHRSEGHMKRLMQDMLSYAREQDYDMLILGGQRQRYEYFGFEKGGLLMRFDVSKTNVRHALKDTDTTGLEICELGEEDTGFAFDLWNKRNVSSLRGRDTFMLDLQSWRNQPEIIRLDGERIGYRAGGELLLTDEKYLPAVVKKLLTRDGTDRITFTAGLDQKDRIEFLKNIAEYSSLGPQEMVHVLNWEKVLKLFLEFKHKFISPVEDGCTDIEIEGEEYSIKVAQGKVSVGKAGLPSGKAIKLDLLTAGRAFFGVAEMMLGYEGIPRSWLGLPFYMSEQDGF